MTDNDYGYQDDLDRCDEEITRCEAELRNGNPDINGAALGLADWSKEKRLILAGGETPATTGQPNHENPIPRNLRDETENINTGGVHLGAPGIDTGPVRSGDLVAQETGEAENATAEYCPRDLAIDPTPADLVDLYRQMHDYPAFLINKSQTGSGGGFTPSWMPSSLFDFQQSLCDWAQWKGRAAIFADCGLGKTIMQLTWAENVVRHTNKPALIITPLAVSAQTIGEGDKFGVECLRSKDGKHTGKRVIVTNYEQLHRFDPGDFAGVVCDESGILKNFSGKRRSEITEFMRTRPYRLLCTATASPNDYTELGTSSEALGELGYTDMLQRFFKNDQNTVKPMRYTGFGNPRGAPEEKERTDKWRFKGHAEIPFWQYVCSWARAIRRPSDIGFADEGFILPELVERQHLVQAMTLAPGMLFAIPAVGLQEQREERKRTIKERCERVAQLVDNGKPALVWCHLNTEGDYLEKIIPGAVQVSGSDSDEEKEECFLAFLSGKIRVLVTKPKIGAWGLNFQHCDHVTFFPSHSFEQYYQGVRRCYRYGQKNPVTVDIVTTEGEQSVLENLQRKSKAADVMFSRLVSCMNDSVSLDRGNKFIATEEIPTWL